MQVSIIIFVLHFMSSVERSYFVLYHLENHHLPLCYVLPSSKQSAFIPMHFHKIVARGVTMS